jgi:hypothetical protein
MKWTTNLRHFATVPLDFLRKRGEVFVFLIAEVCAMCWGMLESGAK